MARPSGQEILTQQFVNRRLGCGQSTNIHFKMASKVEDAQEQFYSAVSLSELKQTGRRRVTLKNGRVIVLFYVRDQVYALDHFCYRESP